MHRVLPSLYRYPYAAKHGLESIDSHIFDGVTGVFPLETGLVVEEVGKNGYSVRPQGAAPDLLLVCPRASPVGEPIIPLLIPVPLYLHPRRTETTGAV